MSRSYYSDVISQRKNHVLAVVALSTLGIPACVNFECHGCNATDGFRSSGSNYQPDELLVRFHEGVSDSRIQEIHASLGVRVLKRTASLRLDRIAVPPGTSLNNIRHAYLQLPEVETVGLNYKGVPN